MLRQVRSFHHLDLSDPRSSNLATTRMTIRNTPTATRNHVGE